MNTYFQKIAALILAVALVLCSAFAVAEDAIDTIMNAKTIQSFTEDPVSEEDLNTILTAGTMAASAINQQPWFFAVITDPEIMAEISGFGSTPSGEMPAGAPGMSSGEIPAGAPGMPSGEMSAGVPGMPQGIPSASGGSAKAAMGDSPVAIVIYMNENTFSPNASFDCGLACQNMVIAANALGYGTKVISSPTMTLNGENHDAFCEMLGVDPAYSAVAVLLIGVADDEVDGATGTTTRGSLEDKVSFVD